MKKTLFLALAIASICIMPSCGKDFDWFTNKTTEGKIKLGWLKIILVSQPDGTHRMRLLETAIQK